MRAPCRTVITNALARESRDVRSLMLGVSQDGKSRQGILRHEASTYSA